MRTAKASLYAIQAKDGSFIVKTQTGETGSLLNAKLYDEELKATNMLGWSKAWGQECKIVEITLTVVKSKRSAKKAKTSLSKPRKSSKSPTAKTVKKRAYKARAPKEEVAV